MPAIGSLFDRIASHLEGQGHAAGSARVMAFTACRNAAAGHGLRGDGELAEAVAGRFALALTEAKVADPQLAKAAHRARYIKPTPYEVEGLLAEAETRRAVLEGLHMGLEEGATTAQIRNAEAMLSEGKASLTFGGSAATAAEIAAVRGPVEDELRILAALIEAAAPAKTLASPEERGDDSEDQPKAKVKVKAKPKAKHKAKAKADEPKAAPASKAAAVTAVPAGPETVAKGAAGERISHLQNRLNSLGHATVVDGQFGDKTHESVVRYQKAAGLKEDGVVGPTTTEALKSGKGAIQVTEVRDNEANPGDSMDDTAVQDAQAGDGGSDAASTSGEPAAPKKRGDGGSSKGSAKPKRAAAKTETLYKGMGVGERRGHAGVRDMQSKLGVKADGRFGPETVKAVKKMQRKHGLKVDGIVGAKTHRVLKARKLSEADLAHAVVRLEEARTDRLAAEVLNDTVAFTRARALEEMWSDKARAAAIIARRDHKGGGGGLEAVARGANSAIDSFGHVPSSGPVKVGPRSPGTIERAEASLPKVSHTTSPAELAGHISRGGRIMTPHGPATVTTDKDGKAYARVPGGKMLSGQNPAELASKLHEHLKAAAPALKSDFPLTPKDKSEYVEGNVAMGTRAVAKLTGRDLLADHDKVRSTLKAARVANRNWKSPRRFHHVYEAVITDKAHARAILARLEETDLNVEGQRKLEAAAQAVLSIWDVEDMDRDDAINEALREWTADELLAEGRADMTDEVLALVEAAGSMAKASTHEPVGKKALWGHKGWQLPAYIQHIANDLREKRGKSESEAIQMAIGIVKRWAKGLGKVTATTKAAAAKAVAEWTALKAKAKAA